MAVVLCTLLYRRRLSATTFAAIIMPPPPLPRLCMPQTHHHHSSGSPDGRTEDRAKIEWEKVLSRSRSHCYGEEDLRIKMK